MSGDETAIADLLIRGGTVISTDAELPASVAIKDGTVLAVGADEAIPAARETLDAQGLHVLPGAIDVHVHFRDPGYPHKEDFHDRACSGADRGRRDRLQAASI
jgi:dihydroorotase